MDNDFECTVSLPKGRGMVKTTRGLFLDAQTLAAREGFEEQTDRWWDRVRDILKQKDHAEYIREHLDKLASRPDDSVVGHVIRDVVIPDTFVTRDDNPFVTHTPEVEIVQSSAGEQAEDEADDVDLGDSGLSSDS